MGRSFLEPCEQWIEGGNLIEAAATLGTVAEVGRNPGQLESREAAKGKRTELFSTRVSRRILGHGKPARG
jgi:hypothetical protein